jgi:hypothetical protein
VEEETNEQIKQTKKSRAKAKKSTGTEIKKKRKEGRKSKMVVYEMKCNFSRVLMCGGENKKRRRRER